MGLRKISKEEMTARVVEPIKAAMEGGTLPWLRPWKIGANGSGLPYNPLRQIRPDKGQGFDGGVNNLILMIASMANGWVDPRWTGRGQAKKKGYNVMGLSNGKGTTIYAPELAFYYAEDDQGRQVRRSYVKGFREVIVFNAQQIQDFPALPKTEGWKDVDTVTGYERAHEMYDALGVFTSHEGDLAAYNPKLDRIIMPHEHQFNSLDDYHGTRLHELGHATGHKKRLDRDLFDKGFGSPEYAYEELVAELFSAFACADAGIEKTSMTENHARYLSSWLNRLDEEPEAFIKASTDAWRALSYVRERVR